MSDFNELMDAVHTQANDLGWHDTEQAEDAYIERMCNNLHDEVSELHEAWRNGVHREDCDKADGMRKAKLPVLTAIEEELADIVIRVMCDSAHLGIDLLTAVKVKLQYNRIRGYRPGGKKS